jgi:thymidylate synthase
VDNFNHPRDPRAGSDPLIVGARTIGEAWIAIAARILESGAEGSYDGLPMRELILATLTVEDPRSADALIDRHADPERLAWMHSNFTSLHRVTELGDAESYATRLRDYAMSGRDQLQWVVGRLRADRTSRSATITTFQPLTDTNYIPCISLLDFYIFEGSLRLVVYAHSIDFGTKGYGNLVELAHVQEEVARQLVVKVGTLTMIVKSAHVYVSDVAHMNDVLRDQRDPSQMLGDE